MIHIIIMCITTQRNYVRVRVKKMKKLYRQGDVLLVEDTEQQLSNPNKGKATLALGEVSGHSHTMNGVFFKNNNQQLAEAVTVSNTVTQLQHQEHDALNIPKQTYRVVQQRRVDVFGEIKRVMD